MIIHNIESMMGLSAWDYSVDDTRYHHNHGYSQRQTFFNEIGVKHLHHDFAKLWRTLSKMQCNVAEDLAIPSPFSPESAPNVFQVNSVNIHPEVFVF